MRLLSCGDGAVLLDCADLDEAQRWYAALAGAVPDAVLGAQTVLLRGRPAALRSIVERTTPPDHLATGRGHEVEIPVTYNGPDLDDVARLTHLTTAEVVDGHGTTAWTAAFGGFAPGFSYLVGGDPRLAVPRRDTPRATVPAGSVGLAGEFSGVYPRSSPGGWQLIGCTDLDLWDVRRDPPALLVPGTRVRFVAR